PRMKLPDACAVALMRPRTIIPAHMESHNVVVIGAGPAGLAAAGALRHYGVPSVVLERADHVAASWRKHYDRLHLHTIRWLSHLPGYKLPRRYGDWVSRDDLVSYLEDYVDAHNLDVRLGVEVERLDREGDSWIVRVADGDDIRARRVVVATGYNKHPYLPDWPGLESFTGDFMRPLPPVWVDRVMPMMQRMSVGDLTKYGLPAPPPGAYSRFLANDVAPILDVGFVPLLREGKVTVVPAVEGFDGPDVLLAGGRRLRVDKVIAGTGFRRGLEPLVGHFGILEPNQGRPLVHGAKTHPNAPGLHF